MIRLQILGGFLMYIYLIANHTEWALLITDHNILSRYLINILYSTPDILLYSLRIIIFLFFLNSIFRAKNLIISYLLAIFCIYIGTAISLNMLSLIDITNLHICQVHHPISLIVKQTFLQYELSAQLSLVEPLLVQNPQLLYELSTRLTQLISDSISLTNMNAQEISVYARNIIHGTIDAFDPLISYGVIYVILVFVLQLAFDLNSDFIGLFFPFILPFFHFKLCTL